METVAKKPGITKRMRLVLSMGPNRVGDFTGHHRLLLDTEFI
jgi:hypothetical protein